MRQRLAKSPAAVRFGVVLLALAAILLLSRTYFWYVDWGTAVIYGVLLAFAGRWPVLLPSTGVKVTLLSGLLLEAIWHHGYLTVVALVTIEFGARTVILYRRRANWEWYRPVAVLLAATVPLVIANLISGHWGTYPHDLTPHIEVEGFVVAYGYWILMAGSWTLFRAPAHRRSNTAEFYLVMRQTWWVPFLFIAVAWVMELVHMSVYPLRVVVGLLLLWLQYEAGTIFSALLQDEAVSRMIRFHPPQSVAVRDRTQRVLRIAHALARAISLSPDDARALDYVTLLQESMPEGVQPAPLWLPQPQEAETRAYLSRVEEVAGHVAQDGALVEVADLIRLRYAAHDGSGCPALAGEEIPLLARVIAAANAIVTLIEGTSGVNSEAEAVQWLEDHAASRFEPQLLVMMNRIFRQPSAKAISHGLPETVRHLQRLTRGPEDPSLRLTGLRRIVMQWKGQLGLAPELPPEVQAVARMAGFFASSTEAGATARIAVEAVGRLMGAKVALATAESEDKLEMRIRAAYGTTQLQMEGLMLVADNPLVARIILNREPVQLADVRELEGMVPDQLFQVEGIRSILFVPLVVRGRITGLLATGLTDYHWFTPQEIGMIQLMADQAAAALENSRLMAEVAERLHHTENLKAMADTLLDNLSTAILVVDQEGRLVTCNAVARERFGERELCPGYPLPPELYEAGRVVQALSGQSVPEADLPWGASVLEVQSVPFRDGHGQMLGAICLARDVTLVRQMEGQVRRVEKLAAIGELAAGAAHEIRNPLTSIRGFIQLIQERATTAEGEYFQIIINEIDRIDGIIRDLLLLARQREVERQPTAIAALIDEVLLLNESKFGRQNIWVSADVDPAVAAVSVDPKMFRQLLLNLVINAVQAMPFGGTLTVVARLLESDQMELSMADTGVGISPENMQRLFVPFYTTKEEGTGLGLALCYSIVQAHGGKIDVRSREGMGTTFTVTVPMK